MTLNQSTLEKIRNHRLDDSDALDEAMERATLLERERIQLECREQANRLLNYANNARRPESLRTLARRAERVAILARAADTGSTAREARNQMTPEEWVSFAQRTGDWSIPAKIDLNDPDDFASAAADAFRNRLPMCRLRGWAKGAPLHCTSVWVDIKKMLTP